MSLLGNFISLQKVWESYPEGGSPGDYIYIPNEDGMRYDWNKYRRVWVPQTGGTTSNLRYTEHVAGNAEVDNDVVIGGSLNVGDLDDSNVASKQSLLTLQQRIDQVIGGGYFMAIDTGGDTFIGSPEVKTLTCHVYNGLSEDITADVETWAVTRDTGDIGSDNVWNAAHTSFDGVLVITIDDVGQDVGGTKFIFMATGTEGSATMTIEV